MNLIALMVTVTGLLSQPRDANAEENPRQYCVEDDCDETPKLLCNNDERRGGCDEDDFDNDVDGVTAVHPDCSDKLPRHALILAEARWRMVSRRDPTRNPDDLLSGSMHG